MTRLKKHHNWITNGVSSKLLLVNKSIPMGWKLGRTISSSTKKILCQQCHETFVALKPKKGDDGKVRCPSCARRKAQKRHQPKQRNKYLKETYDISLEQYNEMSQLQNNVCAICKQPETKLNDRKDGYQFMSVDHDHATGKVRGLLCDNCNLGIGRFSENRTLMRSAMNYLIKYSSTPSWDEYFMDIAHMASTRSKDPSTKVGTIITRDKKIISTGYNGLPRQMNDFNPKYWERPEKYIVVIHAEQNAIIQAQGTSLQDAIMYCTLFPCTECAKSIIQSGIKEVVYQDSNNPRFKESFEKSQKMFDECKVSTREIQL
jgi:dCMP deaminase